LDDVDDGGFPRVDPCQLLGGDALRNAPFQRKLGVEVFAQEAVLQLTGLAQQIHELLPALDAKRRLRRLPVRRPPRGHRSIVVRPAVRWKAPEYTLSAASNSKCACPHPFRTQSAELPQPPWLEERAE